MARRITTCLILLGLAATSQADTGPQLINCLDDNADPVPVHRVPPAYPQPATMFCLQGSVILEFIIKETGRVADIEIVDSDPPGIFDRAAIHAASQWQFIPRCVNGVAVKDQHRTMIDFELEFGPESCPDAIDSIEDAQLELIGKLGASYALLADISLHGANDHIMAELRESLTPEFDGDLGRIEQFHRSMIEALMSPMQEGSEQDDPDYLHLLMNTPALSPGPDELDEPTLSAMRDRMHGRFEQFQLLSSKAWEGYSALKAAVEIDAGVLELLIESFLGQLDHPAITEPAFRHKLDLVDQLLTLFERTGGGWQRQSHGMVFDNPVDQETYERLRLSLLGIHRDQKQDRFNFLRSFEDYRP